MNCLLKVSKPEELEYTMTITMKAKEWEELREQLGRNWPASYLTNNINDLLSQARTIFWPKEPASFDQN